MKLTLTEEKCPRCNGPMVSHPDYVGIYCGSWEYMEGGCPPVPMPKAKDDKSLWQTTAYVER